ncbi:hypothetical protein FGRMN_5017 [Fusarium graminum]|nr:hypothetical protein FGRMN_5017 [Fusarium graminum]
MHFNSIALVATFFGATSATRCYELGMDGDGNHESMLGGLDPFGTQPEGKSWTVVDASKCWARWQKPINGQTTLDEARVTKSVFTATEPQIRATINNYNNAGNTNIQLWLPMHTRSLQYTHMLPGTLSQDEQSVFPQQSISDISEVMVSIILPSGADKLREVYYSLTGEAEKDKNLNIAKDVAITGLEGTIDPQEDYAYITAAELWLAVDNIRKRQSEAFYGRKSWSATKFAWALAEKANGDCVVISFRNFDDFVIRMTPSRRT